MASALRDLMAVAASNALVIAFGIGQGVITARMIGPEGNGIIAALSVYPALFMTFGSLGISQSTTYFVGRKSYPLQQIKTALVQIWMITTLVSVAICYGLIRGFSSAGQNLAFVWLALLPIIFRLFNTYNTGIFLGTNNIRIYNRINWLPQAISFVLTAVLVWWWRLGVGGALVSLLGGPVLMFTILLIRNQFFRAFSLRFDLAIIRSLLGLGIVYAVALVVINLNYKINVVMLDKLSTHLEIGLYAKGSNIIEYLWKIPMLLSTIVYARGVNAEDGAAFTRKVLVLLRISLVVVGLASLILYFLSDHIVLLLFGEEFRRSAPVLRTMLPGVVLLTAFKVMNMDMAGKGKPWISMWAMIPALAVNLVLNLMLTPRLGALGAATASLVSYSLAALLFSWVYMRETRTTLRDLVFFGQGDKDFIRQQLRRVFAR